MMGNAREYMTASPPLTYAYMPAKVSFHGQMSAEIKRLWGPDRPRDPTGANLDFRATFERANGTKIRVQVSRSDFLLDQGLVRVILLQRFKQISCVRLPDGEAIHVKNSTFKEPQ